MKKITFLLLSFLMVIGANAQTNLISNPSFEDGLTGWSLGPTTSYTLPTLVSTGGAQDGSNYVQYASATATTGFYQEVSVTGGKSYTISFYYKASGDNSDARIWSAFKDASGTYVYLDATTANDPLRNNNGYLTTATEWTKQEITFTAPATAVILQVAVRAYTGGTASFDNFSLVENVTPTLSSTPTSLDFSATMGSSSDAQTTSVLGSNLTTAPTYTVTGTDASMFTVTGSLTTDGGDLSVVFTPTSEGNKTASIDIVSGTASTSIALTGTALASNVSQQTYTFKSGLDPWTQVSVTGDQVWGSDSSYGAKMSGYSGGKLANEDWLISPEFDLSEVTSASISFDEAINYITTDVFATYCTLWISSNYTSGDPTAASWTQLTIPTYPSSASWTFVNSGTIDCPAEFIGLSTVRVAFKYVSDTDNAATWEITNVVTSVTNSTGLNSVKYDKLNVYGSNGKVIFNSESVNNVEIYNTVGQKIYNGKTVEGENSIDVNAKGLLIVKVGNSVGKVMM